jgi:hypothetical protein
MATEIDLRTSPTYLSPWVGPENVDALPIGDPIRQLRNAWLGTQSLLGEYASGASAVRNDSSFTGSISGKRLSSKLYGLKDEEA